MYSIINNGAIIDSITSSDLFSEWLTYNVLPTLDEKIDSLVCKESQVSTLETSNIESGFYLIHDTTDDNYYLIQLEKNVCSGYLYGSTISNIVKILGKWELMENKQQCVKDFASHNNGFSDKVIPRCTEVLRICWEKADKLKIGEIPYSTSTLHLVQYQQELEIGTIPKSVKHVTIGTHYRHPLNKGYLPDSIETLELRCDPIILQQDSIPESVKHLIYRHCRPIYYDAALVPDTVETIRFECQVINEI